MLDLFLFNPVDGVIGLLGLVAKGAAIWALVDACIRPAPAYVAAGKQTKTLWIVLTALAALFAGGMGMLGIAAVVVTIVYLVDVRPAVREVRPGGPYGGY